MNAFTRTSLLLGAILLAAPLAAAQCPEVAEGFHLPGVDGWVLSMLRHDDGSGERLYIGGDFTAVGDVPARNIASWDGATWTPVGEGVATVVRAMAVYDDGSGPMLYAGGGGFYEAPGLHRFDGTAWTSIPVEFNASQTVNPTVYALAVHDDGLGDALFVGGLFDSVDGVPAESIARYDGSWGPLGDHLNGGFVQALASYDDGGGSRLYVGGDFFRSDIGALYIASWDGVAYAPLGIGLQPSPSYAFEDTVLTMEVFDDGGPTGPALYVGGRFGEPGTGDRTSWARWTSTGWDVLPPCCYEVYDFTVLSPGSPATALVMSGSAGVQRWDDPVLTPLGISPRHGVLGAFFDGTRERLLAGGEEDAPDSLLERRVGSWIPIAEGGENVGPWAGWEGRIHALGRYESGAARGLLVGTRAPFTGMTSDAPLVARFDGEVWHALDDNLTSDRVTAFLNHDDGSGRALYVAGHDLEVGGQDTGVARYDGLTWQTVGTPAAGIDVNAMTTFRDGSGLHLFAGGRSNDVLRWDGTDWTTVGGPLAYPAWGAEVTSLDTYDDGGGTALYVAGRIADAGGVPVTNIARWTGSAWEDVGGGLTDGNDNNLADVLDLAVWNSPAGEVLVAAGRFEFAGGAPAKCLAIWDGVQWSPLPNPFVGEFDRVETLGTFDPDGNGEHLYAQGRDAAAMWDGSTWTDLGVEGAVRDMVAFDAGDGRALYFGGIFTLVQGRPSADLARLSDPCGADLGLPTCTSLPNSAGLRARTRADGSASLGASDLTLSARDLPASAGTLFFHGSKSLRAPFGDGLRCVGGMQRRVHPVGQATGGTYDLPLNFNAPYAANFMPGKTVYFQAWYRDGMGGPAGFNTTDGLEIVFHP